MGMMGVMDMVVVVPVVRDDGVPGNQQRPGSRAESTHGRDRTVL
jgi:hypothetical protein